MFNFSSQEILIILVIALIVVGPQRLPELSRSIGKGLRELRKVQDDVKDMVKFDLDPEKERTPARRPASPTSPGVHRTPKPAAEASAEPHSQTPDATTPGVREGALEPTSPPSSPDDASIASDPPPDQSPTGA